MHVVSVAAKRQAALASFRGKKALEAQVGTAVQRGQQQEERVRLNERRKWRIKQMQDTLEQEKQQVQQGGPTAASTRFLRQLVLHRAHFLHLLCCVSFRSACHEPSIRARAD